MKALYKIIIFFAVFQLTVIIVNLLGIFPYTLYSDIETQELQGIRNPIDYLPYFFSLPDFAGLGSFFTNFTFAMLVFIFAGIGAVYARATHNWSPVIVIIIASSFVPMITRSSKFFNKLFYTWDVPALTYLAVTLGVAIILIAIITIVETPTHGKSG